MLWLGVEAACAETAALTAGLYWLGEAEILAGGVSGTAAVLGLLTLITLADSGAFSAVWDACETL